MSLKNNEKILITVKSSTPLLPILNLKIKKNKPIADLIELISKKLNINSQYLVLYKTIPVLNSRNVIMTRSDKLRIDYRPSSHDLVNLHKGPPFSDVKARLKYHEKELERNEHMHKEWQTQKKLDSFNLDTSSNLELAIRPLRGDHMHVLIAFYVDQNDNQNDKGPRPLNVLLDRPNTEYIYEGKHILQTFPHFGTHGGDTYKWFSEGLAHTHPGTSWQWFHETEGLGANVDAFLEQVGTWIWEKNSLRYPTHGPLSHITDDKVIIDFPKTAKFSDGRSLKSEPDVTWDPAEYSTDRILIGNTDKKKWRMYYYSYFAQNDPSFVLEDNFGRTWLNENLAAIIFSYEYIKTRQAPNRELIIDRFLYLVNIAHKGELYPPYYKIDGADESGIDNIPHSVSGDLVIGFDGTYYPMPNRISWKNSWILPYIKD